jgi:hypothetical protein
LHKAPCSRHLDKNFLLKPNSEFARSGAPSYFLCFSPRHTLRFYTEDCCSPSLILSGSVTKSFVSVIFLNRLHSPSLISCTNITRTHYIKGVKSSHFFQIQISHGDRASRESPLQIQKASFGSQSWLKKLPSSSFYQPNRFTEC